MIHPEGVASLLPPDFQSSLERPELELSRHSPSTYLPPHCAVLSILRSWWGEVVRPPFMLSLHQSPREIVTLILHICFSWELCPSGSLLSPVCHVTPQSVFLRQYDVSSRLYLFNLLYLWIEQLSQLFVISSPVVQITYYTSSHPPQMGICCSLLIHSTNFCKVPVVCQAHAMHQEYSREKTNLCPNEKYGLARRWTLIKLLYNQLTIVLCALRGSAEYHGSILQGALTQCVELGQARLFFFT